MLDEKVEILKMVIEVDDVDTLKTLLTFYSNLHLQFLQQIGYSIVIAAVKNDAVQILEYFFENPKTISYDGTVQAHIAAALGKLEYFKNNFIELSVANNLGLMPKYFAELSSSKVFIDFCESLLPRHKVDSFSGNIKLLEDENLNEQKYYLAKAVVLASLRLFLNNNLSLSQAYSIYACNLISSIEVAQRTESMWRLLADLQMGLGHCSYAKEDWQAAKNFYSLAVFSSEKLQPEKICDDDTRRLANLHYFLSINFLKLHLQQDAFQHGKMILDILESIPNSQKKAKDWMLIGYGYKTIADDHYYNVADYPSAILIYQQAMASFDKITGLDTNDFYLLASIQYMLALTHEKSGHSADGLEFYQAFLRSMKQVPDAMKTSEDHKAIDQISLKVSDALNVNRFFSSEYDDFDSTIESSSKRLKYS